MGGHTQLASSRERFMQQAREELAAFERRETEFRQAERRERAAQLKLPLDEMTGRNEPQRLRA